MLLGTFTGRLSPKRRVAIPSLFRKILGDRLIVAKWYEGCLIIVGTPSWKALLDRLTAKVELVTEPVRDTDRFILGSAFEIEPDGQGRFVIPRALAQYAELKTEVVFVGLGERVEVWDSEAWRREEIEVSKKASLMIEKLALEEKERRGK